MHGVGPFLRVLLAACAGFLVGVLWMDLMFDVQALRAPVEMPEAALASIAAYYRRVTTDAWPMGPVIACVMVVAVLAALWQAVRTPGLRTAAVLLLVVLPVGLALGRVVPDAVRLGTRGDPVAAQAALARSIGRDHVVCLASMLAVLVLQLVPRRES
jgi:hypothetical protein